MFPPAGVIQQQNTGGGMASLLTGLLAWWDFEEATGGAGTIRYDSHSSNDLTVSNGTVYQVTGQVGFAADSETAAGSFMSRANSSNDLEMRIGGFSCAGWIKTPSTWAAATYQPFIYRGFGYFSGNTDYALARTNSTNKLTWFVPDASAVDYSVSWSAGLSTNTWYFVYAEYEGSGNTLGISLNNGTLQTAAGPATVRDAGSSGDFVFDYWFGSGSWFGKGRYDSVGVWSRVLTTDERTWLSTPRSYSDI
jgi:hypothetical protein